MAVITFTNNAAKELQTRIGKDRLTVSVEAQADPFAVIPETVTSHSHPTQLGYCGTLHGLAFRLLQKHGRLIGLPASLTVMSEEVADALLARCAKQLKAKANQKDLARLRETFLDWRDGVRNWTADQLAVKEYYAQMIGNGMLDFDAILRFGEILLKRGVDAGFDWLFVDEYQDSSDVDARIYALMPCANKFFVGDADQSIYGFRGGNVQNIIEMAKTGAEVIELKINYRSLPIICDAAQRLIEHNTNRIPKRMQASRFESGELSVNYFDLPDCELQFIANDIRKFHDLTAGGRERGVAVLFRTNADVIRAMDYFKAHGLPVVARKYVPDELAKAGRTALAMLLDPFNDMATHAFLMVAAGEDEANKMQLKAMTDMQPLYIVAFGRPNIRKNRFGAEDFGPWIGGLSWMTADLKTWLLALASKMPPMFDLTDLFFASAQPEVSELGGGITVTTYHGSKGREWPVVYVAGSEQELCPGRSDVEEERRLYFVAMTRAMDKLVLTGSKRRNQVFATWKMDEHQPSQFVQEAFS
jgi:superfamily I DNA/RNA helicase